MNPNILISVCARGGSKGIPGKNLKPLNGKPLIDYTLGFINELKGLGCSEYSNYPILIIILMSF